MTRRFWVERRAHACRSSRSRWREMSAGHAIRHAVLDSRLSPGLQLALATPVVLWGGWPFFERGWASIRHAAASTCSR